MPGLHLSSLCDNVLVMISERCDKETIGFLRQSSRRWYNVCLNRRDTFWITAEQPVVSDALGSLLREFPRVKDRVQLGATLGHIRSVRITIQGPPSRQALCTSPGLTDDRLVPRLLELLRHYSSGKALETLHLDLKGITVEQVFELAQQLRSLGKLMIRSLRIELDDRIALRRFITHNIQSRHLRDMHLHEEITFDLVQTVVHHYGSNIRRLHFQMNRGGCSFFACVKLPGWFPNLEWLSISSDQPDESLNQYTLYNLQRYLWEPLSRIRTLRRVALTLWTEWQPGDDIPSYQERDEISRQRIAVSLMDGVPHLEILTVRDVVSDLFEAVRIGPAGGAWQYYRRNQILSPRDDGWPTIV